MMSKSSTITDRGDWLHNAHAGELLLSEFLEPLEMSPSSWPTQSTFHWHALYP